MRKASRIAASPRDDGVESRDHLLAEVIDCLSDAALIADLETLRVEYANRALDEVLGYAPEDLVGRRVIDLYPDHEGAEAFRAALADALRAGTPGFRSEQMFVGGRGDRTWTEMTTRLLPSEMPTKLVAIVRDVTERKLWEDALVRSHARLELLNSILQSVKRGMPAEEVVELTLRRLAEYFNGIRVSYCVVDDNAVLRARRSVAAGGMGSLDGRSVDLTRSPAYLEAVRARESIVIGDVRKQGSEFRAVLDDDTRAALHVPMECSPESSALLWLDSPGPVAWSTHAITTVDEVAAHLSFVLKDAEAAETRRKLEEQLRHSQRMEAVGRLAGGVAHDFNNILTGITGYVELVLPEVTGSQPRSDLEQILKFSRRAAGLTQQLLAFGRRQSLAVTAVDLNDLVGATAGLIERLIGEDIDLAVELTASPAVVRADAGQIEQVLMNLAVNARDAMPEGGRLLIETGNAVLDEGSEQAHGPVTPGDYVMVAVSDTGIGIDVADRERIFEPFFTTKQRGKGTGLGLSTVYGIVKQHGGNVWVYSEPGRGTCFKVYLPFSDTSVEPKAVAAVDSALLHGDETILLVEDEGSVRDAMHRALEAYGYRVVSARHPDEAVEVARSAADGIDLLVTDVVMPGCNGIELHRRLSEAIPGLPVLFMSGYTDRRVLEEGVMEQDHPFVQKPFSPARLVRKLRSVLDRSDADPSA